LPDTFKQRSETVSLDFYILDGLTTDVLVGDDTVEELRIFEEYEDCLMSNYSSGKRSDVNIICYVGKLGKAVASVKNILKPDHGRDKSESTIHNQTFLATFLEFMD
jgi:hypothetical protein